MNHQPQRDPMSEVGLVYRDPQTVDPGLYDVMTTRGRTYVRFTARPLMLMLWAANLGYEVRISDDEVQFWTTPARGKQVMEYFAYPQHEDYMLDVPAHREAVELATWM